MAEYILDLTEADLPAWWPAKNPKKIPICDGKWFLKYDVIEDKMPGFRGRTMLEIKRRFRQQYDATTIGLPFGFDTYSLPPGAKVLKLGIEPTAQGKGE